MKDVLRLERNSNICLVIIGLCFLVIFVVLMIRSIGEPDRKAEYLELCADDGFKPSECLYRWGVMR